MAEFLGAAGIAFGAIFLAEFGDKSQLIILAFATRHPWRPVVIGVAIAAALIQGISVVVGAAAGAALPQTAVGVVAGVAFIGVAIWTLRNDDEGEGASTTADSGERRAGIALVAAVAGTFVAAELGDKTMLATFALATSQGPMPTWVGSTLGEVTANLVAVVIGRGFGTRVSARMVRIGSAVLFALAGALVLAGTLLGVD